MRPLGGVRLLALVIVSTIALTACVSAPAPGRPQLRVLQGGATSPSSPSPSVTAVPEPPVGVIMSGRVVIGCDYGARCAYFARISPIPPERPDPTVRPALPGNATVTLTGVGGATRGFGPTARDGRPGEQEPGEIAQLLPGRWHIDAWTTALGDGAPAVGPATLRGSCGMDFVLHPGDSLAFRLVAGGAGCSIRVAGAIP